jgi:phosphohistidine swiveling domain-containing protein
VRDLMRLGRTIRAEHPELAARLMQDAPPSFEELTSSSPELASDIERHLQQFDFLGTDYYVGDPLSPEQLIAQLVTVVQQQEQNPEIEPEHHPAEPDELAPDDRELLRTARELHFLRQHRIEAMFKAGRDVRLLLTEIGRRIGLGYDELLALTFDEIQESLTAGAPNVPLELIGERMRDYGVAIERGEARIVVGEQLDELRDALPPSAQSDGRLTGVTAFPGECEAPATVVDRLQDVGVVKAGDVLIAPMTSPYHVPAMTIASAVVTNEGGILSHAAIVSRELRIPCIVGVAGATEAIKSGQRVRVDAQPSSGTVEILADS